MATNTYFDKTGKQILPGDLLKVFHFRSKNKNYYMYHIVVIDEEDGSPEMALKTYCSDKIHCRMVGVANNTERVYFDAKFIAEKEPSIAHRNMYLPKINF